MHDMSSARSMMDGQEIIRFRLEEVRRRHRSLDEAIAALEEKAEMRDSLDLRRLKKEKLALKDQITRLEDQCTPDIIA